MPSRLWRAGGKPLSPARTILTDAVGTALSAPVIARTSSAGASPLTWDTVIDGTVYAGYFVQLQVATDSGFTSVTQDLTHILTADDLGRTDLNVTGWGFTTPSGLYYLRMRAYYETDDGLGNITRNYSDWSNVLTDTIVAATAVWNTVNGVNKSHDLTVSGSPALTAIGDTSGAPQNVRATHQATPTKAYWEYTINALVSNVVIIVEDGTYDMNSGYSLIGHDTTGGISFRANSGGWDMWVGGVSPQTNTSPTFAVGDVIGVELDTSGHTVSFFRIRSGATLQVGVAQAVTLSAWYAAFAAVQPDQATVNFGQSAFARTPTSGYTAYG